MRAVGAGGVAGQVLYFLKLGAVSLWFPAMRGNEVFVFVTHLVFGLVAAGRERLRLAYAGSVMRR